MQNPAKKPDGSQDNLCESWVKANWKIADLQNGFRGACGIEVDQKAKTQKYFFGVPDPFVPVIVESSDLK